MSIKRIDLSGRPSKPGPEAWIAKAAAGLFGLLVMILLSSLIIFAILFLWDNMPSM